MNENRTRVNVWTIRGGVYRHVYLRTFPGWSEKLWVWFYANEHDERPSTAIPVSVIAEIEFVDEDDENA
jgi:hypothetical protein